MPATKQITKRSCCTAIFIITQRLINQQRGSRLIKGINIFSTSLLLVIYLRFCGYFVIVFWQLFSPHSNRNKVLEYLFREWLSFALSALRMMVFKFFLKEPHRNLLQNLPGTIQFCQPLRYADLTKAKIINNTNRKIIAIIIYEWAFW